MSDQFSVTPSRKRGIRIAAPVVALAVLAAGCVSASLAASKDTETDRPSQTKSAHASAGIELGDDGSKPDAKKSDKSDKSSGYYSGRRRTDPNSPTGSSGSSAPSTAPTGAPAPAQTTQVAPATATNVSVIVTGPWSAVVKWNPPAGAVSAAVYRDGFLVDSGPASAGNQMTDRLLWPNRTFTYRVKVNDAAGDAILDQSVSVKTPGQSSSVQRFYSNSSFVNQPISSSAATDANSANMIQKAFTNYAGNANFTTSDKWGAGLSYTTELSKSYNVGCTKYDCNTNISFRIPRSARPSTGSDMHLTVVDTNIGKELDMWQAVPSWTSSSRYISGYQGWGANCSLGQHCNGANAAGFSLFAGVVRPEEIAQGHIDHALVITTPFTRSGYIACPATHTDGKFADGNAIPEGARIQLAPDFNVDAQNWPQWQKVIAKALQKYGAYVNDTGGSVGIRGEAQTSRGYNAWSLAGNAGGLLGGMPWSKFRVLKLQQC